MGADQEMLPRSGWRTAIQSGLAIILVALLTMLFLKAPGSPDVGIFRIWLDNGKELGPAAGYKANQEVYPPLASLMLLAGWNFLGPLGISETGSIILTLVLCLFLASLVFWLWTRNLALTALLHLSLILNVVALRYLDILVILTLIPSLWALQSNRLVAATALYCVACLTKWQPLIIAPFLILYALGISRVQAWKQVPAKRLLWHALVPAVAIVGATLAFFGADTVVQALARGTQADMLSGNALNFNWVLTHWLHVLQPDQYGPLIKGTAAYIMWPPAGVTVPGRALFLLTYAVSLATFFLREKTFENLLVFTIVGYLAYFTFNTGVHENHWVVAAVLSICLFHVNRRHAWLMILLVLLSNLNLLVFYGISGDGLGFSRLLAGQIDIALVLALFSVVFFLFLWVTSCFFGENQVSAGLPRVAGSD